MDLLEFLREQHEFSIRTFGPGARVAGVIDHIRKELREIEAEPSDLSEWIDVVLLALDGAMRQGYKPHEVCYGLSSKFTKNKARKWPDWRLCDPEKGIEHIRNEEENAA